MPRSLWLKPRESGWFGRRRGKSHRPPRRRGRAPVIAARRLRHRDRRGLRRGRPGRGAARAAARDEHVVRRRTARIPRDPARAPAVRDAGARPPAPGSDLVTGPVPEGGIRERAWAVAAASIMPSAATVVLNPIIPFPFALNPTGFRNRAMQHPYLSERTTRRIRTRPIRRTYAMACRASCARTPPPCRRPNLPGVRAGTAWDRRSASRR